MEKTSNKEVFEAVSAAISEKVATFAESALADAAAEILQDAAARKSYTGFTGQTQTSYTCGLYEKGKLAAAFKQTAFAKAPVHKKIGKGKSLYLASPYEGSPRAVVGRVNVDSKTGANSALAFLRKQRGENTGWSLITATGTEYSEYIEAQRHLNVMTGTWLKAPTIFKNSLKKKLA